MLKTKTIGKLRRDADNSDEESLFGEDHLDGGLLSRAKNSPHIRSMFKNLIWKRCSEIFNNLQAFPRLHMAGKGKNRTLVLVFCGKGKSSLRVTWTGLCGTSSIIIIIIICIIIIIIIIRITWTGLCGTSTSPRWLSLTILTDSPHQGWPISLWSFLCQLVFFSRRNPDKFCRRMPWHDVGVAVEGPAARDVARCPSWSSRSSLTIFIIWQECYAIYLYLYSLIIVCFSNCVFKCCQVARTWF